MNAGVNEHEIWRERAALYVLDALRGDERRDFETHLETCVECVAELLTLRPATDAMAHLVPQIDPPPALRDRVINAALGASDAAAAAPTTARATLRRDVEGPSRWQWLAAAAMLVLAVGLGAYANSLRGRVSRLESQLDAALAQSATLQARVNRTETTLTSAQGQLTSAQSQLAILTAPDARRVALAGQPGAPSASGRADWSPSRGLSVSVANLPPLLPMRTYQVWLLTKGNPVSAGLLPTDANGRASNVFPVPAGAPEPIGVALSEEPEGGVAQPGNRIYLVGMLARAQ
jgi:anti-sigma-K factor RskA